MSPETALRRGMPVSTSMRYWSAEPIAPPPGAIFASALPASCDAITGCQRAPCIDSRWTIHRQASVASCSSAIATSHAGDSRWIRCHEPNAATRLGATR